MTPEALGRYVTITAYVDASYATNEVTRWSHTGFIIFLNRPPTIWFTKRQNTVEASTFSNEFVAAKCCVEHIIVLRFKSQMFGVPIDNTAKDFCDNKSLVKNSLILPSTLNRTHSSTTYHSVRRAVSASIIKFAWIDTNYNLADTITKQLTGETFMKFFP